MSRIFTGCCVGVLATATATLRASAAQIPYAAERMQELKGFGQSRADELNGHLTSLAGRHPVGADPDHPDRRSEP